MPAKPPRKPFQRAWNDEAVFCTPWNDVPPHDGTLRNEVERSTGNHCGTVFSCRSTRNDAPPRRLLQSLLSGGRSTDSPSYRGGTAERLYRKEAMTPDQLQPGSTIARRGRGGVVQIYQLLAVELYRRIDGGMSQVAIWVTNCRSCGREFEVRTAATQRAVEHAIRMGLVVRCRRHRRRSKSRRSE